MLSANGLASALTSARTRPTCAASPVAHATSARRERLVVLLRGLELGAQELVVRERVTRTLAPDHRRLLVVRHASKLAPTALRVAVANEHRAEVRARAKIVRIARERRFVERRG